MEHGKKRGTRPADDPRWTSTLRPAAGELRLVHAFVTTANPAKGSERLTSPRALADWLALWGLTPRATELSATQLQQAIEVREGLRALIGRVAVEAAAARLNRAAAEAALRVRFDARGRARREPLFEDFDGALARLLEIVAGAQDAGSWPRLKVCAEEACGATFYDFSSNSRAKWCSPRCGGRLATARWRRRERRKGNYY